jgi:site-specific DNA-adenine methylase
MNINEIPGKKWRKKYFENLIEPHLPENIKIYVEPFAGSFSVANHLKQRPELLVYNDIHVYEGINELDTDHIEHLDYKDCIEKWDSVDTVFYLDPPYFRKEDWYGGVNNDQQFHEELRETLMNIKGKWFMNYESCPFIEKLYRGFNIYDYSGNLSHIKDILIKN